MKEEKKFSNQRADKRNKLEKFQKYLRRLVKLGVNLRQDWFFRIVFGRKESIPMLRSVMNGVLRNADEPPVDAIKIKNPFKFGSSFQEKDVILDVAVEDESGDRYDVEMQTWNHANFRERIVYYLEKIAAGQLSKGETYDKLHKVIGIVFVDFPIWSELDLQKLKNLTPELSKKLKETQFETIKLMSVENGVVFSDCLTLYFIRVPEAGEPFSSNIRDPKLINWLKAFRFPESTSGEEMFQLEETTPELEELRKQMFKLLATPKRRDYIESKNRFFTTQRTILKENATILKENATILKENAEQAKKIVSLNDTLGVLNNKVGALSDKNAMLSAEIATLRESNDGMQKLFCSVLVATASERFKKPVTEIEALLDGRTQKTLGAAYGLLNSNADYDEFVKVVSNER